MRKKTLLLLIAVIAGSFSLMYAQEHNPDKMSSCRYVRKKYFDAEGYSVCYACAEDRKKEAAAIKAEDKRRSIIAEAKLKEERARKAIADKKQREEDAKKNKVTEVFITAPPASLVKTKPELPVKKISVNEKQVVMYSRLSAHIFNMDRNDGADYFLNVNGDTILKNSEWKQTYGANSNYPEQRFPANTGVVTLKKRNTSGKNELPVTDIVDLKGKRLFNDESISAIGHLADDWFYIVRGPFEGRWGYNYRDCEELELYNIKTKKSIRHSKHDYANVWRLKFYNMTTESAISRKDEKPRGSYRGNLVVETTYSNYIVYYIMNDGSMEIKNFSY